MFSFEIFSIVLYNYIIKISHSEMLLDLMHTLKPINPVVDIARTASAEIAVSVASGGSRHHVHETLKVIGVLHLFEVVVTQEDVSNSKPAPDLFLLAAEKMGIEPEKCLVFEDSHLGIEAAKQAGMQSVYIEPIKPEAH